jgi:hypothetical protein
MKIKTGKRYLTRDGRVAFVFHTREDTCYFVIAGSNHVYIQTKGKVLKENEADEIVAPYKPKKRVPKVGDKVIIGHEAEILEIDKASTEENVFVKYNTGKGVWWVDDSQIVRFLNKESGK